MMKTQSEQLLATIQESIHPQMKRIEADLRSLISEKCQEIFETLSERFTIQSGASPHSEIALTDTPLERPTCIGSQTRSYANAAQSILAQPLPTNDLEERERSARLGLLKEQISPASTTSTQTAQEKEFENKPFFRPFRQNEIKHQVVVIYALNIAKQKISELKSKLAKLGINPRVIYHISYVGDHLTEFIVPLQYSAIISNILNRHQMTIHQTFVMDRAKCTKQQLEGNLRRLKIYVARPTLRAPALNFMNEWIETLEKRIREMPQDVNSSVGEKGGGNLDEVRGEMEEPPTSTDSHRPLNPPPETETGTTTVANLQDSSNKPKSILKNSLGSQPLGTTNETDLMDTCMDTQEFGDGTKDSEEPLDNSSNNPQNTLRFAPRITQITYNDL
jgi:hypothetical protein